MVPHCQDDKWLRELVILMMESISHIVEFIDRSEDEQVLSVSEAFMSDRIHGLNSFQIQIFPTQPFSHVLVDTTGEK